MTRTALVVLGLMACSPAWAQVGGTNVPAELPADIKDWEELPSCHSLPPCELTLANAIVEYDLYVKPGVGGIYAVSHYRVRPTKATGMFKPRHLDDYHGMEVVFWFPKPGARPNVPFRVFIKRDGSWHEAGRDSSDWATEAAVAHRVWKIHVLEQLAPESLATTEF